MFMKEGLEMVANAIMQSTTEIVNAKTRDPIADGQIWTLLANLGIKPHVMENAYLFLVQKPDMLKALLGCPGKCSTLVMAGGNVYFLLFRSLICR